MAADYLKWFEISTHYGLDYVDTPVFEYSVHAGGLTYDLVSTLDDAQSRSPPRLSARPTDVDINCAPSCSIRNAPRSRIRAPRATQIGRSLAQTFTKHLFASAPSGFFNSSGINSRSEYVAGYAGNLRSHQTRFLDDRRSTFYFDTVPSSPSVYRARSRAPVALHDTV